jgi:hypothetical protein
MSILSMRDKSGKFQSDNEAEQSVENDDQYSVKCMAMMV